MTSAYHWFLPLRRLTFLSCLVLLFAADVRPQAPEPWQTDWEKFLDELAPYLRRGDGTGTIMTRFQNSNVTWEGEFIGITGTSNDQVSVRMNSRVMFCCGPRGYDSRIDFRVSIAEIDLNPFRSLAAGTRVRFRSRWTAILPTSMAYTEFLVGTTGGSLLPASPAIQSVVNGASFGPQLAGRSWITIRGSGLSETTRIWQGSDFTGDRLPTSLDGVSVKINNKDSAIYYVSPIQLNVLSVDDAVGAVSIIVANRQGTAQTTATMAKHAPAFFMFDPDSRRYIAAVHLDGTLVGRAGLFGAGVTTRPVQPGGRVLLYATGFGDTNPPSDPSRVLIAPVQLAERVAIRIGGVTAEVEYAGQVGSGLYQFNIIVPNVSDGDQAVVAEVGGVSSPAGTFLTVSNPQAARPAVAPSSLVFRLQQPGPNPQAQDLQVTSTAAELTADLSTVTSAGGNWLRVGSATVTTPGSVSISVITAGLAIGSYTGEVRVTSGADRLTVPVLLTVFAPTATAFTISTLAGTGTAGSAGDGGAAAVAQLDLPFAVAADAAGNVYAAEFLGNRVRKITPTGTIQAFAGTGELSSTGDGGPSTSATVRNPTGLAVGPDGSVLIAEYAHRIRRVAPDGTIQTYAGTGQAGSGGDGGPAVRATLNLPTGLALDDFGNLFVAEVGSGSIRKISAAGIISTVAQGLDRPDGVAVDRAGNVYAAEFGGRILKYGANGQQTVVAQGALGSHVAADYSGNVYLLAPGQITRNPGAAGLVIAGTGTAGFSGDNGAATAGQINTPRNLAFLSDGTIFLPDRNNNRVRRLAPYQAPPQTFQLTSSLTQLTETFLIGGAAPAQRTINLAATNSGAIDFTAEVIGGTWATVTPTTGRTPASITVGFSPAGLSAGNYEARIRFSSANASNSPLEVPVRFSVTAPTPSSVMGRITFLTGTAIGSGKRGNAGVPGPAIGVELSGPTATAVDSAGNIYVCDGVNHRILKATSPGMGVTLFAGAGTAGFSGDGGQATAAQLNAPSALAINGGYLYVADTLNHRIRRIDLQSGIITPFAGSGPTGGSAATFGGGAFTGDNGPAASARLNTPTGLAADATNLYIADSFNFRIRRVRLPNGETISTVAGTGVQGGTGDGGPPTAATIGRAGLIALSPQGTLWIPDSTNHRIREVDFSQSRIRTVAGTGTQGFSGDGGAPSLASFDMPVAVAFDSNGGALISDMRNNRIRRVHLGNNSIYTVAGGGATRTDGGEFSGDGFAANFGRFWAPAGLTVTSNGTVLVADSMNMRIRTLTPVGLVKYPVLFDARISTTALTSTRARVTVSIDYFDSDMDIIYTGSTGLGGAKITATHPHYWNCTTELIDPVLHRPNVQSGSVSLTSEFHWQSSFTSTDWFPIEVRLVDAAGNRSAGLWVWTKQWFSLVPCM